MASNPVFAFCPYLPLQKPVEFGGWWLGSPELFQGPWLRPSFEDAARKFLTRFRDAIGKPLGNPSILARIDTGADGVLPNEMVRDALQAVLHFCTLDANPAREEATGMSSWGSWQMATSDNSELFLWPLDDVGGQFAVQRGSLVRTLEGGGRFDSPDVVVSAPLELHLPLTGVRLDAKVFDAIYSVLVSGAGHPQGVEVARVQRAIRWLAKAWKNSESITFSDRLVFLKTGFESLLDESAAWDGAVRLRELFTRVAGSETHTDHLLWSPTEAERHIVYSRSGKPRERKATDLESWYDSFANARNDIIHEGSTSEPMFTVAGTRYEGPHFHTGERVLREAIKMKLTELGCPRLWWESGRRRFWEIYEEKRREFGDDSEDVATSSSPFVDAVDRRK
jgi:hypothetical protein